MNEALFESTKLSAYFLWEHTGCDNALNLWYCAEDIACFLEQSGIRDSQAIDNVKKLNYWDDHYIKFVRHLAFRIHIYTNRIDAEVNWFTAERLLNTAEWVQGITRMASIYHKAQTDQSVISEVRSANVRAYYDEQTFHSS